MLIPIVCIILTSTKYWNMLTLLNVCAIYTQSIVEISSSKAN